MRSRRIGDLLPLSDGMILQSAETNPRVIKARVKGQTADLGLSQYRVASIRLCLAPSSAPMDMALPLAGKAMPSPNSHQCTPDDEAKPLASAHPIMRRSERAAK